LDFYFLGYANETSGTGSGAGFFLFRARFGAGELRKSFGLHSVPNGLFETLAIRKHY
jgi:hypothetical protein